MARRMVERGVRFVQVLHGAGGDRWDDHGDVAGRIPKHYAEVDKPVGGLIADLAAGADVKAGATFGETDQFSVRAASDPVPMRDVHATILEFMGLDQHRLSVLHGGRYKKLTDIGGRVIGEVIA